MNKLKAAVIFCFATSISLAASLLIFNRIEKAEILTSIAFFFLTIGVGINFYEG